jgi:hypothetical protein
LPESIPVSFIGNLPGNFSYILTRPPVFRRKTLSGLRKHTMFPPLNSPFSAAANHKLFIGRLPGK